MFSSIIKSLLTLEDATLKLAVSYLEKSPYLSKEEQDVVKALKICADSKTIPSYEYLVSQYSILNEGARTITGLNSLYAAITMLNDSRRNAQNSKKMLEIADKLSRDGMTDSLYKEFNALSASLVKTEEFEYEDPLDNAEEEYEHMLITPRGLAFGVKSIDDAIGGIHHGSFNVLFAYTGGYKTTCAINIAYNNVTKADYNVVYISLEVAKKDLMWNIYSRHSFEMHSSEFPYLPHDKMRHAKLTDKEKDFLYRKVIPDWKEKKKGQLLILDETDFENLNFMGFEKRLREMDDFCQKKTGKGIDCIFVDQAQLLKYGKNASIGNEGSVINSWVSFFREQCINFLGTGKPVAVVMLSQANREGWKRACKNNGSYDLRAISEANELERAAYRVFSIFTDENMKQSKEAKVQLLKNRSGVTLIDPVTIFVDPVCYTFGDVGSGFNDSISLDSIDDIFSSGFGDDSLFG